MEIKFIGSGSGKTSINRFHSSILVKSDNSKLLIDAGDGVSRALLKRGETFSSIDVIYFTHYHSDHFAGIASLITQMKLAERKRQLKLFTFRDLVLPLEQFLKYSYLFKEAMDFEIEICVYSNGEPVKIDESLKITAEQNSHIRNKYDYNVPQDFVFYSASLFIETGTGNIFYSSDVGSAEDFYLFNNRKFETAILETTHVSPGDLSEFLHHNRLAKIILTHIDDEMEDELMTWKKSLPPEDNERVFIAEDGSSFYV